MSDKSAARPGAQSDAPWWADFVSRTVFSPTFDQGRRIFTNRSLRLDKIRAIGFDFDHTLAHYNCEALDSLAMNLVIKRLVEHEGMPKDFVDDIPEPAFARKGLAVDIEEGNVCKIDRFGYVVTAYHGTERLSPKKKRKIYGDADHIPHVTHKGRFMQVDTAFAKPEVLIFAALARHVKDRDGHCRDLWNQIRSHTDMIHRDGSLKKYLMADPAAYLEPDLDTVPMLRQLRDEGKKVFLLTNSETEYTRAMVRTAFGLGPDTEDREWIELFDFVVCEARKPTFFRRVDDAPTFSEVEGHDDIVAGGHISELEERLGVSGLEVLYVGDHIYGDLITSKQSSNWRTMLVIPEIEEELAVHAGLPGSAMQMKQADERRLAAEQEVHYWEHLTASLARGLEEHGVEPEHEELIRHFRRDCADHRDRAAATLQAFISQRERLRSKLSEAMSPYWGSLFRAGAELTHFGKQLEDFACTYTSRATNIGLYPPDTYFRSHMDHLPHELQSM